MRPALSTAHVPSELLFASRSPASPPEPRHITVLHSDQPATDSSGLLFGLAAAREPAAGTVTGSGDGRGSHRDPRGIDQVGTLGQQDGEGAAEAVASAGAIDDVSVRGGDMGRGPAVP